MRKSALRSFFICHFSFFIFILFSIFYLLSSAAPAYATSQAHSASSGQANYPVANTNSDVPNNLHNWTQNVMIEVMSALTCQLAGVDPINSKQGCLGIDSASGKIGFLPKAGSPDGALAKSGGAIGFMGNMIATLYTPPLHTSDYFQNLAQNFGISKKTYAQNTGAGFQGLTPLIGVWSAFRNIVYLFLVIVFLVIGLAIMLRVKIDRRTVMTIQNQIPKIIIGIVVVTFSFAIAGFLIDLMWVFIYLIFGIFSGMSPEIARSVSGLNPTAMQESSPLGVQGFGGIASITWHSGNSIVGAVTNLLGLGLLDFSFMNILIHALSVGVGAGVALFTKGFQLFGTDIVVDRVGAGFAAGVTAEVALRWIIPYAIAYLVILIALLVALFRLWFALIMAYVHILIDVVLAPFWIIGGIIPGSPISLSGWLRDIIANLAAFPAVIGMFMLGKVFMDAFTCDVKIQTCKDSLAHNFVPPLIGNPGDPSLIGSLIGLGIILMTPNVVNMLKTALKAPKIDTGGVGRAVGAGVGVLTAPVRPVAQGFTFLAGQKAAQKIPFIGNWLSGGTKR